MSPTLVGFMESLVLDPAKYREFTADPESLLTESRLTEAERRAIFSGEVSTVTRVLDGESERYLKGAIIVLFAPEHDN